MAKEIKEGKSEMQKIDVSFETKREIYKNPKDVLFLVKYPKSYKGKKYMPEGEVITSKESAEIFIKKGIGKIL